MAELVSAVGLGVVSFGFESRQVVQITGQSYGVNCPEILLSQQMTMSSPSPIPNPKPKP